MKWVVAIVYCILLASLANIRSCTDQTVLHVGAFNHAETLSE